MSFASLMVSLAGPVVKRALASIGMGVVTYAGLQVAVNGAISAAQSSFGGLAAGPAAILAMSGVFTAMGIIAGGIISGITMIALKRFQIRTG